MLEPAAGDRRQHEILLRIQDAAQLRWIPGRRTGAGQQLRRRRFQALADSALRAIKRCAPYKIPAQFMPFYGDWRDWNITFDPKDLLG